jgi:hypothetical protein
MIVRLHITAHIVSNLKKTQAALPMQEFCEAIGSLNDSSYNTM